MSLARNSPSEDPVSPLLESSYLNRNMLDEDEPPAYVRSQHVPPTQRLEPRQALPNRSVRSERLVVAVDFGTTFSGVAYATAEGQNVADLSKIKVLQDWTTKMSNLEKVPSVMSYTPPPQGEAQWGSDVSPEAVTMVNQKLELELQNSRLDELDLTLHVLRGTGALSFDSVREAGSDPEFTCKAPEVIVKDYLEHIFKCTHNEINGTQLARTGTPLDLVITMPVSWSYQAFNSMFKAVTAAGFNTKTLPTLKDIIVISEPEAAAYFTARDLKDRGTDFLQENHCFILCDAGGGTVDAVAYKVKTTKPFLELERATKPTGAKCGSTLIDTEFKRWLRDVLGTYYAEIDPVNAHSQRISPHTAESGPMRTLIKRFNLKKAVFSNLDHEPVKIDLPAPLNNLSIDGRVYQGELTIAWTEMKRIMDTCVNGVIELILDQIREVEPVHGRRSRDVFLVGGFGASPYLRQELHESFDIKKKRLRRPDADKSLTAVVQGGVIYGIGKNRHKDIAYMKAIEHSYGIVHDSSRFEWLIRKGDLILTNESTAIESGSFWHVVDPSSRSGHQFMLYTYNEDGDDDDEDLPKDWQTGQNEVRVVGLVKADFSQLLGRLNGEPRLPYIPKSYGPKPRIGPLKWRLTLKGTYIAAELLFKNAGIGSCKIDLSPPPLQDVWDDPDA